MTLRRNAERLVALCLFAVALGGCISLLPKTKPASLFRFGQPATAPVERVEAAPRVGVFRTAGAFQRGSSADRLMTVTGDTVAYVAETRWVAPAILLWDEAVLAAFDTAGGPARLVSRGEPASADLLLRLDVRTFETRYDRGAKAAPEVVVRVRGAITRGKDHGLVNERIFEAHERAGDNRVSAIVPAYDRAVGKVLSEIVAWTNDLASAG